jgi:hypothetical protein
MLKALSKTDIKSKIDSLFIPNPALLGALPPNGTPPPESGEKINFLFLDVDGVLNSHKIQILKRNLAFHDGETLHNPDCTDIMAAGLVNKLCEATNSLIILSSSWRIGTELDKIRPMLAGLGIKPELVIGKTDTLVGERGDQITRFWACLKTDIGRDYLIKNELLMADIHLDDASIGTYAIIDDDSDEVIDRDHRSNFIKTTFMDGLTCALTIEAGKVLSQDPDFYLNRLGGSPSAGHTWEKGFH